MHISTDSREGFALAGAVELCWARLSVAVNADNPARDNLIMRR